MSVKVVLYVTAVLVVILLSCGAPAEHVSVPTATPAAQRAPSEAQLPSSLDWSEAAGHVGEYRTVCGPVVDAAYASSTSGRPTFINLGKKYPDPGRFTVLIWGEHRSSFPSNPEQRWLGKTICVHGLIESYKGGPEIEATAPEQIAVHD